MPSTSKRFATGKLGLGVVSAVAALGFLLLAPVKPTAHAADWTYWKGPSHDRTSPETKLIDSWKPRGGNGSNLLWKSEELAGRSTPIVMAGKLYTLIRDEPGTETEGEAIVCADAETGEILWKHRFNVYLSDVPDTRVGWSSVTGDPSTGRVYALGVCGYFCCLEGDSGKVVWDRSLHEELGLLSTYGGRTNFPIVYKDSVIVSAVVIGWGDSPKWNLMAKPAHRFMAFNKATGELNWLEGTRLIPYDTTYSVPTLTKINGQDQLVFGSGDGAVWGMQPGTGKTVWSAPLSRRGLNVSPAVGPDGRVYTGHSEENIVGNTMGAFVAIDGTKSGEIADADLEWKNYQIMAGKSSPLLIDGKVYVTTDSAKMLVFDTESGKQLERKALGRVSRGSPLYADGKIYYCSRGGRFYILEPKEDDSLGTVFKTSLRGEQVDASPIVAKGRIYLTTSDAMYCLGNEESIAANQSSGLLEAASEATPGPATHVRISPYDSLVKPGEQIELAVHLADDRGVAVSSSGETSWSVDGPGEISPEGIYTAPENADHVAALIKCTTAGGLTATARVRIVPPLPWKFDFESLDEVPLTWVGGRIRYNLRTGDDGNHYLAKPTELPTRPGGPTTKLGTRSRMWMGSPDLKNYTVQADVLMKTGVGGEAETSPAPEATGDEVPSASVETSVKLPSIGLINSRYTFTLFGPNSEARLYSWCTHDRRTQQAVKMDFQPDTWYTMKMKVVPEEDEGHAHVYAKVWPREETEPSAWTLEFEDEAPNYHGSPGLFGDAKEAEFYVDNLEVTPN